MTEVTVTIHTFWKGYEDAPLHTLDPPLYRNACRPRVRRASRCPGVSDTFDQDDHSYPAGGTLDLVGRSIAQNAQPSLGQTIVPDNQPGATGVLAHGQIACAAPDGYTIGISGLFPLALASHQYKSLPYHPIKDFPYRY